MPNAGPAAAATLPLVLPMQSDAFVDSIGVNTHLLAYLDRPARAAAVTQRIQELGLRHVRDGIFPGLTPHRLALQRRFFSAASSVGMEALIDCPQPLGYYPGSQTPPAVVRSFDAQLGRPIDALEGPNEPDLRNVKGWAPRTRACIAHDDRALPVPFVAPAMGDPDDAAKLGNVAGLVDAGGIHRYFQGHEPETRGFWKRNACGWWEAIRWSECEARIDSGRAHPLYVTETGWSDSGTVDQSMDEKTQGKYVSRVLFYDSVSGIARTYLYDFQDDGTDRTNDEDGYGLIRFDGSPKPSFNAVRAIVHLLGDPGAQFRPVPLRLRVSGPATVETELFERRDGEYTLVLWNAVPSWDPVKGRAIAVRPVSAGVTLAKPPGTVHFFTLGDDGNPVAGAVGRSSATLRVTLEDRISFLSFWT